MHTIFSRMIGTVAVILLVAAFIGSSDFIARYLDNRKKWKRALLAGLIGGIFGIYGNLSGLELRGAVISVRDIGPMLSGYIAGPYGGLIAGLIAGIHRLTIGGMTAEACVVATCSIGFMCGMLSEKRNEFMTKPYGAFLTSAAMETFHLLMVLAFARPFDAAVDIVKRIAIPFVAVNALGFMLMMIIMSYTKKQHMIALERSRLQSELEVANVIQHSLLPVINKEYPGITGLDIGASMEAAKEVGGDFYDVFFVDNNRLAFVIGDVSGKGVPAALFMATSKITLQNTIRNIPKLSTAMEVANNTLCSRNEAEMFVTLWVGILDTTTNELTYVSAGHNPPIVVRGGQAEYLRTKGGFVLAGMENMKYKEHTLTLDQGDMIYLYTDGVTEAETVQHDLFGEQRLLACFENTARTGSAQMIEVIKTSVDDFVKGNSQFDDMTMLCFKLK